MLIYVNKIFSWTVFILFYSVCINKTVIETDLVTSYLRLNIIV